MIDHDSTGGSEIFGGSYKARYDQALMQREQELHDAKLFRPYEDDQFPLERLDSRNRTLRVFPELQTTIEQALSADDDASLIACTNDLLVAQEAARPNNETVA